MYIYIYVHQMGIVCYFMRKPVHFHTVTDKSKLFKNNETCPLTIYIKLMLLLNWWKSQTLRLTSYFKILAVTSIYGRTGYSFYVKYWYIYKIYSFLHLYNQNYDTTYEIHHLLNQPTCGMSTPMTIQPNTNRLEPTHSLTAFRHPLV